MCSSCQDPLTTLESTCEYQEASKDLLHLTPFHLSSPPLLSFSSSPLHLACVQLSTKSWKYKRAAARFNHYKSTLLFRHHFFHMFFHIIISIGTQATLLFLFFWEVEEIYSLMCRCVQWGLMEEASLSFSSSTLTAKHFLLVFIHLPHVYYHWARRGCLSFKLFPLGDHFQNSHYLSAWLCINIVWRNCMFISAETGLVATRLECFKTNNHESTFLKKAKIGVANVETLGFIWAQDFFSLAKGIETPRGYHKKALLEYLSWCFQPNAIMLFSVDCFCPEFISALVTVGFGVIFNLCTIITIQTRTLIGRRIVFVLWFF